MERRVYFEEPLCISIHSPRMGRDGILASMAMGGTRFQSTLPAWGETDSGSEIPLYYWISIHSPRMGRDGLVGHHVAGIVISIHSPRMGRDLYRLRSLPPLFNFNPLSPHGERHSASRSPPGRWYFNPLSPHGERHGRRHRRGRRHRISIHSPRMG